MCDGAAVECLFNGGQIDARKRMSVEDMERERGVQRKEKKLED